jgi:hypothetical protein
VNVHGNLVVTGNISFTGNATTTVITGNTGEFFGYTSNGYSALYAGIPSGFLFEPQTVFQITSNYNGYSQLNMQNINSGNQSSSDFIVTADNGSANDTYLDLGLASSTYNYPGFTLIRPNDGYFITYGNTVTGGGNTIIATGANNDIVFAVGGVDSNNEMARFKYNTGLMMTGGFPIIFADNTSQNTAAAPYAYSNSAFKQANNISTYANAQILVIAGVDATQNTNIASAQSFANGAFVTGNSAGSFANGAFTQANNISAYANAQILVIAGVDATQNTNITSSQSFANGAFSAANSGASFANGAFTQANNISSYANAQILVIAGVDATQNTNITTAQGTATSAGSFANGAFAAANSAASFANGAFLASNGASTYANNTFFTKTGGTITGTTTINTGYLSVNYNPLTIQQTAVVNIAGANTKGGTGYVDFLNANNQAIGATSTNKWFRIDSVGNLQVINSAYSGTILQLSDSGTLSTPNFTLMSGQGGAITFADGTVQYTANGGIVASSAASFANGAFAAANSAASFANGAFVQANNISSYANAQILVISGVDATQNTNITTAQGTATSAGSFANGAFVQANNISTYANAQILVIAGVDATQNTNITTAQATATSAGSFANGAFVTANAAFNYANTQFALQSGLDATQNTNINTAQSTATSAGSFANGAFGQANTALNNANIGGIYANLAFGQANSAASFANGAFTKANTAVTSVTGTSGQISSSGGTTPTVALIATSVSAGTYGGSTAIPVITFDAYGRATSAANATISTSISLAAGSGSGSVAGGGTLTISGGTAISTSASGSTITINNTGVTSLTTNSSTRITTSSSTGAAAIDLATISGLTSGSYTYPSMQVDAYGRVTTISNQTPVTSFNTRTGAVTLSSSDVTTALGYTPINNAGATISGNYTGATTVSSTNLTATDGTAIYNISTNHATTTATTQVTVDSFSTSTYRSAKYIVQMTSAGNYHTIELLVLQNGSTASMIEYGEIYTSSSLGTFDASISSGNLNLLFTPASSTSTTVNIVRDAIGL